MLINHDGKWGTVCDDSWDSKDATVVCRELLLGSAKEAVKYGRLGKGKDSDPIWLSMVRILGVKLPFCLGKTYGLNNTIQFCWQITFSLKRRSFSFAQCKGLPSIVLKNRHAWGGGGGGNTLRKCR